MKALIVKKKRNLRRKQRIRKKVSGSQERPRLSVFRSAKHISVQAVDDLTGQTLGAASTYEKALGEGQKSTGNILAAKAVGQNIAQRLLEKGISQVVFDRGASRYHGRVAALAQAARDGGLKF